ncbi:MAG: inositol monophosphatase family protein [Caldilineaceae bacterium]
MAAPLNIIQLDIESVIDAAQAAADLVLQMQRDGLRQLQSKSSAIDIVTEADLASEKLLRARLSALLPEAGFWGEESNQPPQEPLFWLVDPIDGTTNFANNIPFFCISVALNAGTPGVDAEPHMGVIVELPSRRVFYGQKGKGAFVREANGVKSALQVNANQQLRRAVVASGFPYHRGEAEDNNSAEFAHFMPQCQSIRTLGSAALELAYVATGALTAFWEGWLGPWDAAAGTLLVREAGGQVVDYLGQPWVMQARGLIAHNGQPAIEQALVGGIQTARAGLKERKLHGV